MTAAPPRPEPAFALLGSRAMAFILDVVLLTLVAAVIVQAALALQVRPPDWTFHVVVALYLAVLPATPLQATLGKRMVGLRICDRSGKRIGILRSLLRLAAFVPSIGIAGAGFVLAAFTPRRQALHDLAAGTLVVNRAATPEAIARLPAPVSAMNRIGLVLGFVILAWSVYTLTGALLARRGHDYASELLVGTHAYSAEVARALRSKGPMPAPATLPPHARAMSARPDGTIVVEVADDLAPGGRLTLRPEVVADGEYLWVCRTEAMRYVPAACRP